MSLSLKVYFNLKKVRIVNEDVKIPISNICMYIYIYIYIYTNDTPNILT